LILEPTKIEPNINKQSNISSNPMPEIDKKNEVPEKN
jgi:hypothetical protein